MAGIDLIPHDYVVQRRLRQQLKWFVALVIAIVCIVAAGRAALWFAVTREQRDVARLRTAEQDGTRMKAALQAYEQQKAAAQKDLALLAELRGTQRLQRLLRGLDAAYVEGVWFDEVRSQRSATSAVTAGSAVTPSAPAPAQAAAPAPQAETGAPVRVNQYAELTGHAIDHSRLASFIAKVAGQPFMAQVQLLDTSSRTYNSGTIIDFKVSLRVNSGEQP